MMNDVFVDEPTANAASPAIEFIESFANGDDVARPSLPVKLFVLVNVLKSDSSVDDAAPERDVRYVVVSTNVTPEVFVRSRPAVVVDIFRNPRFRFVVEAVRNEE